MLKTDSIDGIVGNKANRYYSSEGGVVFDSQQTLSYIDCAITLKDRKIELKSIQDFYGKSIWAFKTASKVLGKDFGEMAEKNPRYHEEGDQEKQLDMLIQQRIDVAISDRNIFHHNLKNHPNGYSIDKFSFYRIHGATPRNIKFRTKVLRDLFNEGLTRIKNNGAFDRIISKYENSYQSSC